MDKPQIGQIVLLKDPDFAQNRRWCVLEVYERIDVWWDTAIGENKVALMDTLDEYGPEKAATAEWYAMVENVEVPGETMAIASFECEPAV